MHKNNDTQTQRIAQHDIKKIACLHFFPSYKLEDKKNKRYFDKQGEVVDDGSGDEKQYFADFTVENVADIAHDLIQDICHKDPCAIFPDLCERHKQAEKKRDPYDSEYRFRFAIERTRKTFTVRFLIADSIGKFCNALPEACPHIDKDLCVVVQIDAHPFTNGSFAGNFLLNVFMLNLQIFSANVPTDHHVNLYIGHVSLADFISYKW